MKVIKKQSMQGEFAEKFKDIKHGDIITILDEGTENEGKFGMKLVFKIKTRNGEKLLTFNQSSVNNLIDAYGDDTAQWIGKTAKIWIVKSQVAGSFKDVVYLAAPDWTMGTDGFHPSSDKQNDIPVIEEEIKSEDIPF